MKFDLSHIELSHYDKKRGLILPKEPSEELAEFIGIVLGDGHLHTTENCITITGSLEDFHYYTYYVIPLINKLFNINASLKRRKDRNSYYLYFYSQGIMNFLSISLNMCRGNKINARIPSFILKKENYICAFLRGLFDTDGCLKFSKQTKNLYYYPRVELGFKVSNFVFNVIKLVKRIGFNYSEFFDNKNHSLVKCQISGKQNLEKWIKLIGSNNPVQKTKYLFYKKYGYYVPKLTLIIRAKSLSLNMNDLFHELK